VPSRISAVTVLGRGDRLRRYPGWWRVGRGTPRLSLPHKAKQ